MPVRKQLYRKCPCERELTGARYLRRKLYWGCAPPIVYEAVYPHVFLVQSGNRPTIVGSLMEGPSLSSARTDAHLRSGSRLGPVSSQRRSFIHPFSSAHRSKKIAAAPIYCRYLIQSQMPVVDSPHDFILIVLCHRRHPASGSLYGLR